MSARRSQARLRAGLSALAGLLVLAVVVLVAVFGGDGSPGPAPRTSATGTAAATVTGSAGAATGGARAAGVPAAAYATLKLIDAGDWPEGAHAPGTKGGTVWQNRGGSLPRTADGAKVTYLEWDVNPKRPGRSRDAQRIVTGSDGSAWYTGDHYSTFTRMR
ncbi:ribonuclease [Rhodococcus sp. D2-41]|uniref:Ribonuclease n=1 Tax=Speluncibacter jeojiensis TaxID=2710754 RepID=A0A9X4M1Y7_9ACTN|nr:ribonuclease domain-containing protein [Rhodococcus sp. D2-41]MDG3008891.1 ribonuclease [Rhodococcus sp. D2-41]MDG3016513.1 ribonuclease [Corynebacteriales bacterium D3-21]